MEAMAEIGYALLPVQSPASFQPVDSVSTCGTRGTAPTLRESVQSADENELR